MTTINSVSGMSGIASQLFKTVDANSDGKLSTNEFQSFLEGLIGQLSGASAGSATSAGASAVNGATDTSTSKVYQPMLGFDYVKLNTPDHTTPKYVFARATQDLPFSWDRPSRSAGLQQIADYAKDHGYPGTKVVGDDGLDFGDGNGTIDVLTGDGQWWWGPKS